MIDINDIEGIGGCSCSTINSECSECFVYNYELYKFCQYYQQVSKCKNNKTEERN